MLRGFDDRLVSVIIPTYNRAGLLSEAMCSVLSQTHKNYELLIIDDGSSDNTGAVVNEFIERDKRIRYIKKENGGQGSARNLGIRNAKGKYIAFLDSDDEWLVDKLEKQFNFMETHPAYDFCYTDDEVLEVKNNKRTIKVKHYSNDIDLSFVKLAGIATSVPSSHLYKKECFDVVGFFDENRDLIGLEDNDWSVRGWFLRGYCLNEPLTVYRLHPDQITKENISKKIEKQINGLKYILEKDFPLISVNKNALSFRYKQIGHLCMLSNKNKEARFYFRKSIHESPDVLSRFLIILSFFPSFFYKIISLLR